MTISKKRAIVIFVVAFIVAASAITIVDKAWADSTGHQRNGIHKVRVSRQAVVRYRVRHGYRVRAMSHARAKVIITKMPAHRKSRLCLEFGKDSPFQTFPTIHFTCYHQMHAVLFNLIECGGSAGIGALVSTPAGAPFAALGAFAGCEFSKSIQYFNRITCPTKNQCALRTAGRNQHELH